MQESIKVSGDLFDALFRLRLETDEAIIALKNIEDNEGVQVFVSEQWPDITGYPEKNCWEAASLTYSPLMSAK